MQQLRATSHSDEIDLDEEHGAFALGIALLANRSSAFSAALSLAEPWRLQLAYAAIELQRSRLLCDARALGDAVAMWPVKRVGPIVFGAALPGLRRALGRVGRFPMRSGAYRLLGRALSCAVRRKLVFHAPRISSGLLILLDTLPNEAVSAKVLGWDHGDPNMLCRIACVVREIKKHIADAEIGNSWKSLRQMDDTSTLRDWLHEQTTNAALPVPPWNGAATITPVRTLGELRKLAQEFRNCLWGRRVDFISGVAHVYICRDDGIEALASVYKDELLGWCLSEIKGIGNCAISPESTEYLIRKFSSAGIGSAIGARPYWGP